MAYKCYQLEGMTCLPPTPVKHSELLFFPAMPDKNSAGPEALYEKDFKGILAIEESVSEKIVPLFIFCYQFIFPQTRAYQFYSNALPLKPFLNDCNTIDDLIKELTSRYEPRKTPLIGDLNFDTLATSYTHLPKAIAFNGFFDRFKTLYDSDEEFSDIIALFLFSTAFSHSIYNNLHQKIAQLQTIFDLIIGKPPQDTCKECGQGRNAQTWAEYIATKLPSLGIDDKREIELISEIKRTLNRSSRIRFVHDAAHLNTSIERIREMLEGNFDAEQHNRNLESILSTKSEQWNSTNWENIFLFYGSIVRNLICVKYELLENGS